MVGHRQPAAVYFLKHMRRESVELQRFTPVLELKLCVLNAYNPSELPIGLNLGVRLGNSHPREEIERPFPVFLDGVEAHIHDLAAWPDADDVRFVGPNSGHRLDISARKCRIERLIGGPYRV